MPPRLLRCAAADIGPRSRSARPGIHRPVHTGSTRGWIGAMCPTLHVLRAVSIGQRPAEAVQWSAVHTGARSLMDRASDYGSEGWGFESLRARKTEAPPPASGDGALPVGAHAWHRQHAAWCFE